MDCPFCAIAKGAKPEARPQPTGESTVFLSTPHVVGFFDIQPLVSAEAHVLIIPRKHYETLDELSGDTETAGALGIALSRAARALKEVFGPKAFNVVQNNGSAAGQVVNHVHFHLVIRPWKRTEKLAQSVGVASELAQKTHLTMAERASYSALVFGRGQRQDLDLGWAQAIIPEIIEALDRVSKL